MNNSVTVAIAQLDLVVGDVSGNTGRIIDAVRVYLVFFP
jgi:predicted amidohydrolase